LINEHRRIEAAAGSQASRVDLTDAEKGNIEKARKFAEEQEVAEERKELVKELLRLCHIERNEDEDDGGELEATITSEEVSMPARNGGGDERTYNVQAMAVELHEEQLTGSHEGEKTLKLPSDD
jgi:hypothetical protein